jgi:hypothetical protein
VDLQRAIRDQHTALPWCGQVQPQRGFDDDQRRRQWRQRRWAAFDDGAQGVHHDLRRRRLNADPRGAARRAVQEDDVRAGRVALVAQEFLRCHEREIVHRVHLRAHATRPLEVHAVEHHVARRVDSEVDREVGQWRRSIHLPGSIRA